MRNKTIFFFLILSVLNIHLIPAQNKWGDSFKIVEIKSPLDGAIQKAYFYPTTKKDPQPLIVNLHTWSNDYTQYDTLSDLSKAKDYNYIHPDFRGANRTKDACCSELVISDIDAAIDFAIKKGRVDPEQIFVIGTSGGGYATISMFMKSKHKIKKFSAWVPLVDLIAWYRETSIRGFKYADEILACTHSRDGDLNEEIAKSKSPIYWDTPVEKLKESKLEIYAGVYDGMEGNGTIPITHSINFYNKVLKDLNVKNPGKFVSDQEKLALLEFREPLGNFGTIGGREVFLSKGTNNLQLILFEGGHEILSIYAFEQLFVN